MRVVSIVSLFRLLSVLNYFSNLGAELQTQALTLEVHKKTLIFFSFFFLFSCGSKCPGFFDFSCHIQYMCLSWVVMLGLNLDIFPTCNCYFISQY